MSIFKKKTTSMIQDVVSDVKKELSDQAKPYVSLIGALVSIYLIFLTKGEEPLKPEEKQPIIVNNYISYGGEKYGNDNR